MDFAAYLVSKNIDNQKFADTDKALFDQWEREFMQMNPKSFTLQKLFKINEVRRKYQLHMGAKPKDKPLVSPAATAASKSAAIPKPAIKADITNVQSTENPTDKDVVNPTTPTVSEQGAKAAAKPLFKRPVPSQDQEKDATPPLSENAVSSTEPAKKTTAKPVFKRPGAVANTEVPTTHTPQHSVGTPNNAPETSMEGEAGDHTTAAPKKAIAKPVFKRPDAVSANTEAAAAEAITPTPKKEDINIEDQAPKEDHTTAAPKKAMAKPVFKRPDAVSANTEAAAAEAISPTPKKEDINIEDQAPKEDHTTAAPKKAMAKPVFKRPDAVSAHTDGAAAEAISPTPKKEDINIEDQAPKEDHTTAAPKKAMAKPVFKRPDIDPQQ